MSCRVRSASRSTTLVVGLMAPALMVFAGCSNDADDGSVIITEEQIAAAERRFEPIGREEQLFVELLAGEPDRDAVEAFVEDAYAPGIVFDDVSFGAYDEGRDRVASMYGTFLIYFADAEVSWRPLLVGAETAVSVITFAGLSLGPTEFTVDAPLVEVDLIAVDDDQIAAATLFYERAVLERMFPARALHGDPEAYIEAWNSRQTDRILELYSVDATRLDGIEPGEDPRSIGDSIERFSTALDGATWALDLAFAQAGGDRAGAVFTVTSDDCAAELAVVWTYDDAGSITHEIVHYAPSSVLTCPWVE